MQVTARSTAAGRNFRGWRLALSGNPNHLPLTNPGRNFDFHLFRYGLSATAPTIGALLGDQLAAASALWASRDHPEHAAKPLLHHLALSPTGSAGFGRSTWCCSRPLAGVTHFETLILHGAFGTFENLGQRQFNLSLEIEATFDATLAAPTTKAAATTKNILEHGEDVFGIHRAKVMAGSTTEAFVTKLVIPLPSVVIRQDFVGL